MAKLFIMGDVKGPIEIPSRHHGSDFVKQCRTMEQTRSDIMHVMRYILERAPAEERWSVAAEFYPAERPGQITSFKTMTFKRLKPNFPEIMLVAEAEGYCDLKLGPILCGTGVGVIEEYMKDCES